MNFNGLHKEPAGFLGALLIVAAAVVFVWAVKLGERVHIPKKKHGRLARSVFRVGISLLLVLFRKPGQALLDGFQLWFPKLVRY